MAETPQMLSNRALTDVLSSGHSPCISLYQRTHRCNPEKQQNPVRFRKLVKELEKNLHQKYPGEEMNEVLNSFKALGDDLDFWNHSLDGVAVLGAPGVFQVFTLPRPINEMVVVADSFHTKPLRRIFQSMDRFQVLAVTRNDVELFEGNRYDLEKVELHPDVPRTLTDALGGQTTKVNHTMGVTGGPAGSHPGMAYGYNAHADQVHLDEERFFRAVDKAIFEHHSRFSKLPLILAALPEHHGMFHKISHNNFLLEEGIRMDPHAMKNGEMKSLAWAVVEPRFQAQLKTIMEEFAEARAKDLGSDDLKQVAEAAAQGRVATLLVEDEKQIKGRLNCDTGELEFTDVNAEGVEDMLDDLAELVEHKGGRVLVIPAEDMPTTRGLAAVYRY